MQNLTDIICGCAFLFFFLRGFTKGFIRALLGPISLFASICIASYYYTETGNHLIAGAALFFGPFIIRFVLSLILRIWNKSFNEDLPLSMFSRFIGGTISLSVSGTFLCASLILILMIPKGIPKINEIQDAITFSKTYGFIHQFIGDKLDPITEKVADISKALQDPEKLKKIATSPEYENLLKNPTFTKLISDEKNQKDLKDKNISELLKNKQLRELLKDKDAIKNIFALQKQIIDDNMDGELKQTEPPSPAEPKVVEIEKTEVEIVE